MIVFLILFLLPRLTPPSLPLDKSVVLADQPIPPHPPIPPGTAHSSHFAAIADWSSTPPRRQLSSKKLSQTHLLFRSQSKLWRVQYGSFAWVTRFRTGTRADCRVFPLSTSGNEKQNTRLKNQYKQYEVSRKICCNKKT